MKVTKSQKILNFVREAGTEGRKFSEVQKFIVELNGLNWDEMQEEQDWRKDGHPVIMRRRYRGYYCTNLLGTRSDNYQGIFARFNIVKNVKTGRWVASEFIYDEVQPLTKVDTLEITMAELEKHFGKKVKIVK